MTESLRIYGGNIVTPEQVIQRGTLVIEEGKIVEVLPGSDAVRNRGSIDASGLWVLPGLIDSHSDAIENEIQPRPNSTFPIDLSLYELERKLAGHGITTIYHSISMLGDRATKEVRRNEQICELVSSIRRRMQEPHLIAHKVHLRFEVTNISALSLLEQLLRKGAVDELSFMDHTPGQGQYRNMEEHQRFLMAYQQLSSQEAKQVIEERLALAKAGEEQLARIAEMAKRLGIPLASHDDDSVEKIALAKKWKTDISEFPVELEVAREAKRQDMYVVMGAPNVLRGGSASQNLSAREAIEAGVVDILCSDYYPPSLLHVVFFLYHQGYELPQAVNMVSSTPARALGIAGQTGSIEVGKAADILLVREDGARPVLEKVFAGGRLVCQMSYA